MTKTDRCVFCCSTIAWCLSPQERDGCPEGKALAKTAAREIEPGRCYYEKRVGNHWEVWFCRSDSSADPASGASEWKASSVKYWRWINAARTATEMWRAFNDGVWIANCQHADLAEPLSDTHRPDAELGKAT